MNKTILITIFCLLFKRAYSQNSEPLGIFDINTTVSAFSKVWFAEADEAGESSYRTERLLDGNWKIIHRFHKPTFPNPLSYSYSFGMAKIHTDSVAIDIQAAMPPSALYLDTTALQLSYIGSKIILPNKPSTSAAPLANVNGVCTLRKIVDNSVLISYEISLNNRNFFRAANIILNGKTYDAYTHTYDCYQKTVTKTNQIIAESNEAVEETYIVGYGLVSQTRKNLIVSARLEGANKVRSKTIISELLDLR